MYAKYPILCIENEMFGLKVGRTSAIFIGLMVIRS